MTRNRTVLVATTIAALALPAAAQAHVTLQPSSAPAGAFMKLDVRVPTELDNASTSRSTSASRPASPRPATRPSRAGRSA